jgi:hypothetical protein
MQGMMKRARIASDLHLPGADGGAAVRIPAGQCWVLERPAWVLLMWQTPGGPGQAEVPVRDYLQQLSAGVIHAPA